MPLYESTFIARHDMSTRQVESLAEDLTTIVKDNGGEVAKTEFWGPRTLAYRIKKNRKATTSSSIWMRRPKRSRNTSATCASTRTFCAT